jgi:hypothetical protein
MVEQNAEPTTEEWRDLYQAADEFKQLGAWEWMLDSDLFGVRDPETGQIGYCCVMGNLGEHFALGLYLGGEGLRGYMRMQTGEFWPPDIGALFVQDCLMASFEDREVLSKRDRDQIKALGRKYRGRSAWPQFRNYRPGYFPWYLSGAEARFLTQALRQSCDVASRFEQTPELLDGPTEGQLLVRVFDNGGWRDTWAEPELPKAEMPPMPPLDETLVQRVRQAGLRRAGTWESDCFYTQQVIQEHPDQRPYYAKICMFVDGASGMILPPQIGAPENWREVYQDHLPALAAQVGAIPREVVVRSAEMRDLLAPAADRLGVKVRVARQLPMLDEAYASFMEFMD